MSLEGAMAQTVNAFVAFYECLKEFESGKGSPSNLNYLESLFKEINGKEEFGVVGEAAEELKNRVEAVKKGLPQAMQIEAQTTQDPILQKIQNVKNKLLFMRPKKDELKEFKTSYKQLIQELKYLPDEAYAQMDSYSSELEKIKTEYDKIKKIFDSILKWNKQVSLSIGLDKVKKYKEDLAQLKIEEVRVQPIKVFYNRFSQRLESLESAIAFLEKVKEGRTLGSLNQFKEKGRVSCTCCAGSFLSKLLNLPSWDLVDKVCIDSSIKEGSMIFLDICRKKDEQVNLMVELTKEKRVTADMVEVDFRTPFLSWFEVDKELYYKEIKAEGYINIRLDFEGRGLKSILEEMKKKKQDRPLGAIIIHNQFSYAIAIGKEGEYLFFDSHGNRPLNGSSEAFLWKFKNQEEFISFLLLAFPYNDDEQEDEVIAFFVKAKNELQEGPALSAYIEDRPKILIEELADGIESKEEGEQFRALSKILKIESNHNYNDRWLKESYESAKSKLSQKSLDKIVSIKQTLKRKTEAQALRKLIEQDERQKKAKEFKAKVEEAIQDRDEEATYIDFLADRADDWGITEKELIEALFKLIGNSKLGLDGIFDQMSHLALRRFCQTIPRLDQKLRAIVELLSRKKPVVDLHEGLSLDVKKNLQELVKRSTSKDGNVTIHAAFNELIEKLPASLMRAKLKIIEDIGAKSPIERLRAFKELLELREFKGEGIFKIDLELLGAEARMASDHLYSLLEGFFNSLSEMDPEKRSGPELFKTNPLSDNVIKALDEVVHQMLQPPKKRQKIVHETLEEKVMLIQDRGKPSLERIKAFRELLNMKNDSKFQTERLDLKILEERVLTSFGSLSDLEDFTSDFFAYLMYADLSDREGEAIFQAGPLDISVLTAVDKCLSSNY